MTNTAYTENNIDDFLHFAIVLSISCCQTDDDIWGSIVMNRLILQTKFE